ncbi:alpha/beta fold hydrolase [Dictyobacter arantiisoli]|uniref:Dihydrolipoamide acetyltransferase n=1 Tax=Dictyobacter arantiisoli TaxID=2014874 RepID=A0A5A5TB86_9CHLR|nr:alpha/beta hydrolase [Dictyobacter arantiisoli]GCF08741.1 dihydrolipoamide acetyltransferase [Dictyobacter arantiisoli]
MQLNYRITSHHVSIQGQLVRYRSIEPWEGQQQAAQRETIVLVHGLAASSYWWQRNLTALAAYYHLYLIDLPGFGSMHRQHRQFQLATATSWLFQWTQAVGLTHAHFIGHSMGGVICARLAAEHPTLVERLILVAPAVMPPERLIRHYLLPLGKGIWHTTPTFWPILTYDALRTGPCTLLRVAQQILTHDSQAHLKAVTNPTLLIWGRYDTLVPVETGYKLVKTLSQAQLVVLPRAGHVCMFEQASLFDKHVLTFLQSNS